MKYAHMYAYVCINICMHVTTPSHSVTRTNTPKYVYPLQHEQMLVVRKEGKAHDRYNSFRSAFELLESVGRQPSDCFEEDEKDLLPLQKLELRMQQRMQRQMDEMKADMQQKQLDMQQRVEQLLQKDIMQQQQIEKLKQQVDNMQQKQIENLMKDGKVMI